VALNHADEDDMPLDRDSLVETVAAEIQRAHEGASTARVYALVGSWGSGKTWVLSRVIAKLRASSVDSADPVIEFNPWLFGSDTAIGQGFATALLSRTGGAYKRRRSAARLVENYGPIITPFVGRLGLDSAVIANRVSERLSDIGSPSGIRKLLTQATKNRQLIVVMDDLDRLTPEELLTVFKLMRVVGDIPNITYVLGYDEETLLHLVASTTIGGGAPDRARSYMEKIIERVFVVPPLSSKNVEDLVFRPLVDFGRALFPDWSETDQEVFVMRQRALLSTHITTPRAAHRLLDSVRDLTPQLAGEVNYDDWFLSAFLHVFYPEVWALISRERVLMTGESYDLFDDGQVRSAAAALKTRFETMLLPRDGGSRVLSAILRAFEGFSYRLNPLNSGSPYRQRMAVSKSIGHPDFVDRYIWRSLPPGSISEAFVRQSLVDLSDGKSAEGLRGLLDKAPSEALDAIYRHSKDHQVDVVRVLLFIEEVYPDKGGLSTPRDVFGIGGSMRANFSVLLTSLSAVDLNRLTIESPSSIEERTLLCDVLVGPMLRNTPTGDAGEWARSTRTLLSERLTTLLPTESFEWGKPVANHLLTLLRADVEVARAVVNRQLDSGKWDGVEVAALWLEISNRGEGPRIRRLLGHRLLRDLGPMAMAQMQVAAAGKPSPLAPADSSPFDLEVNRENAVYVAANGLRMFDPNAPEVADDDDE